MRSLLVRKPSKKLRRIFLFIGVPLVSLCLTFISLYTFARVQYSAPPVIVDKVIDEIQVVAPISLPVRLTVTAIGVDTAIRPAGLASNGNMDISENPDEVAWYQLGTKPGQRGSAVIAGHYGWKDGHGSVFNSLHTLVAGDKVSVYDDKGVVMTFVVRETRKYDPAADATEVFKSTDGGVHLNLITCDGTWVQSKDSYTDRLVVFTDLEK